MSLSENKDEQPEMSILVKDHQHAEMKSRLATSSSMVLYIDFESALGSVVEDPEATELPPEARSILEDLSTRDGVLICLASGRSPGDLRARVGIPSLVYSGYYGLEIEAETLHFVHPEAVRCREMLQAMNQRLVGLPLLLPGVEIESRALATTLHHGEAPEWARRQLETILRSLIPRKSNTFVLTEGRSQFEIRPRVDWDGGTAFSWLHERVKARAALAVVIGDDRADPDSFRSLDDAITFHVGDREPTTARFWLHTHGEVLELLE